MENIRIAIRERLEVDAEENGALKVEEDTVAV